MCNHERSIFLLERHEKSVHLLAAIISKTVVQKKKPNHKRGLAKDILTDLFGPNRLQVQDDQQSQEYIPNHKSVTIAQLVPVHHQTHHLDADKS